MRKKTLISERSSMWVETNEQPKIIHVNRSEDICDLIESEILLELDLKSLSGPSAFPQSHPAGCGEKNSWSDKELKIIKKK